MKLIKISYNLLVILLVLSSMQLSQLVPHLMLIHKQKKLVVLATGAFDLLHEEHKNFLQKAKAAGDILVVGLESDKRVSDKKGMGRPIWNQEQRLKAISDLSFVDFAFILPENFKTPADHLNVLQSIQPNILAVSSHSEFLDRKIQLMSEIGGKVEIVHQHNPAVSTSLKITELVHCTTT